MAGFVIEYNRRTGHASVRTFDGLAGHREAMLWRLERERALDDPDVEIVSLASESLEMVQRTHSRYFSRARQESVSI